MLLLLLLLLTEQVSTVPHSLTTCVRAPNFHGTGTPHDGTKTTSSCGPARSRALGRKHDARRLRAIDRMQLIESFPEICGAHLGEVRRSTNAKVVSTQAGRTRAPVNPPSTPICHAHCHSARCLPTMDGVSACNAGERALPARTRQGAAFLCFFGSRPGNASEVDVAHGHRHAADHHKAVACCSRRWPGIARS